MGFWEQFNPFQKGTTAYKVSDLLSAINPVHSLLYNIFAPEPTFEPEKEWEKVQRSYADYLQKELNRINREIAQKTKAEMSRRGVYVGSAYAPVQQRMQEATREQLQRQLGQMAVQGAQQAYSFDLQKYLAELQQRQQQKEKDISDIFQALGMVMGAGGVPTGAGSYQTSGWQLQPSDYNTIAYVNAFLQANPDLSDEVRLIINQTAPELLPYIRFTGTATQQQTTP